MKTKSIIKIVLSCPSDVTEESDVFTSVIEELNRGVAEDRNLRLEVYFWETHVYPGYHLEGPQGLIDPVLEIPKCDILVGIFWKRFGTPTMDAMSGTEHEFKTALKCWRESGRPQIMLYFKHPDLKNPTQEEWEQLGRVIKFRESLPPEGLHWSFTTGEFSDMVRNHLQNYIRVNFPLVVDEENTPSNLPVTGDLSLIHDYCRGLHQRFITINLLGDATRKDTDQLNIFSRMSSMNHGYVPIQLGYWSDDNTQEVRDAISLDYLVFKRKRAFKYIIRGLPGGGKTTLLRHLVHRFGELGVKYPDEHIPVFFNLRYFNCSKTTLEEFIKEQINQDSDSFEMLEVICTKKRFLERPMVLLCDGIDEIEDGHTGDRIAKLLNSLAREHPRCRIIVTSRPIGLNQEDYPLFQTLDLLPLSQEVIDDYLRRWFGDRRELMNELRQTLKNKPRIRSLATNPFLLSMICYTYTQGGDTTLIERRSQLYENCTQHLLQRTYDKKRGIYSDDDFRGILEILKDISLRFFLWQEADFGVEYVNIIGGGHSSAESLGKTERHLNQIQRQTGLIQSMKNGFTFVHRSLWEYFTALSLLEKKKKFIILQAANPDWEEVVRLYAGLLSNKEDIQDFIESLWDINRPLALRVTTETSMAAIDLIQPLIAREQDNQGRLLLIDSLEQSLPLIPITERANLVLETLRVLLFECSEKDCQVIYHAQKLLEREGQEPLKQGGLIYDLLDLAHSAFRLRQLSDDPMNHFDWIDVDGGIFLMGDDHDPVASPAHLVKVDSFKMAKHPVTNRMFALFPLGDHHSEQSSERQPVVGITWWEAYYFALWVHCRLPKEAEWEYAARGGKDGSRSIYFFGDNTDELPNYAWFGQVDGKSAYEVNHVNPRTETENLNPLGFANILGNVWEWCHDWFGKYTPSAYENSVTDNPEGPASGIHRVMRGGSFRNPPDSLRCARRINVQPAYRNRDLGLRLVKAN